MVDWSGGWATPWGIASQMRPCSEAKRLIGRPQESAQPERKSTPRYAEKPYFFNKTSNFIEVIVEVEAHNISASTFLYKKFLTSLKQKFII